jgi:hypothetical protein
MLLADKHDLQNKLRLNLLQIEEKELNFYTQSCYTVGTQAALLAGFAFGAITEVDIDASYHVVLQITWLVSIVLAMILEIGAVVKAMQLSILGPGLALRGPDGSVLRAILVMREEYVRARNMFYAGLVFFHAAVVVLAWAQYIEWAAAAVSALVVAGVAWLASETRSVARKLQLDNWDPAGGARLNLSFDQSARDISPQRDVPPGLNPETELRKVQLRPRDSAKNLIRQTAEEESKHVAQLWPKAKKAKRGLKNQASMSVAARAPAPAGRACDARDLLSHATARTAAAGAGPSTGVPGESGPRLRPSSSWPRPTSSSFGPPEIDAEPSFCATPIAHALEALRQQPTAPAPRPGPHAAGGSSTPAAAARAQDTHWVDKVIGAIGAPVRFLEGEATGGLGWYPGEHRVGASPGRPARDGWRGALEQHRVSEGLS